MHRAVAVDFLKTKGDRGSMRLPEKNEELSRDQTSIVIAFITIKVMAR